MKNEYYLINEGDEVGDLWVVVDSNNDACFSSRSRKAAQAKCDEVNAR
jgi:hypothetical protein